MFIRNDLVKEICKIFYSKTMEYEGIAYTTVGKGFLLFSLDKDKIGIKPVGKEYVINLVEIGEDRIARGKSLKRLVLEFDGEYTIISDKTFRNHWMELSKLRGKAFDFDKESVIIKLEE